MTQKCGLPNWLLKPVMVIALMVNKLYFCYESYKSVAGFTAAVLLLTQFKPVHTINPLPVRPNLFCLFEKKYMGQQISLMVTHGYLTTLNYIRIWMFAVRVFRSTSAFLCELTLRLSGIFYSMDLYLHVLLIWCPHHIWGHKTRELVCVCLCMATLTEVFPCFFLSCKANARVKPAKTGHGPHSS